MRPWVAGSFLVVAAACQPHVGPESRARARPEPRQSWCAAVESVLSSGETREFRCLAVPNFLITGFFGPARNPERSDFVNACFGGDDGAAARLRMKVRPAGDLSFRYLAGRKRRAGGGLDLSGLGPWAPKLQAGRSDASSFDVEVQLEDAEIRVLASVAEILGQEWQRAEATSPLRDSLASCIGSVCANPEDAPVYTAKVLAAVPVITLRSSEQREHGLALSQGAVGFSIDERKSTQTALVLRGKEKLNIAALLEQAAPAFENARTCARVRAVKLRGEVLSGLRELGLRTLAGRALEEIPVLAAPLRKSTRTADGAFSENEQRAILDGIETIEGAARQLALPKPNNSVCAVRSLAEVVLTSSGEGSQVHGTVVDVVQPIHERLTELANSGALPCAEPQWFLDLDRDGYGDKTKARRASVQPPGHVANALDCYDQNPEAHPGQDRFFAQHRGDGSFDYDCDGNVIKRDEVASEGCREVTILGIPTRCWADTGWVGGVPGCGQQGRWLSECEVSTLSCEPSKDLRATQECR